MNKTGAPDPLPPDIAHRLHGSDLGTAFRLLILDDPQVVTLARAAATHASQCKMIFEGAFPGCFTTSYQWPLQLSADELADACVYSGTMVPGPPSPKPTKAVFELAKAIVCRLTLFQQRLAGEELRASGTYDRTGNFGPIHQAQWVRANMVIDTRSSDLLEIINGTAMVQWSGVIVELFHVNTAEPAEARPSTTAHDPTRTKNTPQRASIDRAIAALWPHGISDAIQVKVRDQMIIDWQKKNGLAVVNSKTIQRYLAEKTGRRS